MTSTEPARPMSRHDADQLADESSRLLHDASRAAVRRAHDTNPDVVALVATQTMRVIERAAWTGITLGLLFTMTSVQQLGAGDAVKWSLPWLAAWLLAPTIEIPLLAILWGEQLAGRHGVAVRARVHRARWVLLSMTYALNTWAPWTALIAGTGPFRDVLLHSAPVLAVVAITTALLDMREMTVEIVEAAVRATRPTPARTAARRPARTSTPGGGDRVPPPPPPGPPSDDDRDTDDELDTDESTPSNGTGPLGDGRTMRQIGVDWALANWHDELMPVEIGRGVAKATRNRVDPSKGERGRMRADAAAIVAAARQLDPTAYPNKRPTIAVVHNDTREEVSA